MILTCCLFNITWLGCLEILLAHISYIISRTSVYTVSELLSWSGNTICRAVRLCVGLLKMQITDYERNIKNSSFLDL